MFSGGSKKVPDAAASKVAMELLCTFLLGLAAVNICSWRMGSAMRPQVGLQSQRGRKEVGGRRVSTWHGTGKIGREAREQQARQRAPS